MSHLPTSSAKTIALTVLLAVTTCAQANTKVENMNKSSWPTRCFGRFEISVPPQARVNATYNIRGNAVERIHKPHDELRKDFDKLEKSLISQEHKTKGKMFFRRTQYGINAESILAWSRPYSVEMMHESSYFISPDGNAAYQYEGDVSPDRISIASSNKEALAKSLQSLDPDGKPKEPGFCIDGGYFAGKDYRSEGFDVGITLPDHPGAHITFYSSTGAEKDTLLERTGGFFRTQVLGTAAGLHTLRKGKRNIGPIQGEEYLIASSAKGQRLYAFKWESQGKDHSLAEPNLSLELNVMGQDDDESTPPKAFQSDEEALKLWDSILESIRLRPGAV